MKLAVQRQNLSLLARDGAVISGRVAMWAEMDADAAASSSSKWVRWTSTDMANANSKQTARFALGDFAILGEFLHELIGNVHQPAEILDAK